MQRGDYHYFWKNLSQLDLGLLDECSELFSAHYGLWGDRGARPGLRIKLSPSRLREFLSDDSWVVLARYHGQLVGYAFGIRESIPVYGTINWVTQLVVHSEHRHRNVASWLLFTFWGFSDHFAWGLVTSNPYAVRALERITQRRCEPDVIMEHSAVIRAAASKIPYVAKAGFDFHQRSAVDTGFHISHVHLPEKLRQVQRQGVPWTLGAIDEGEEWLAFTFKTQRPGELRAEDLESLLDQSEQTARWAYERMAMGPRHRWAGRTVHEVEFALQNLALRPGSRVLDLGCGPGRHSLELARRGFDVVGVDFVESFITEAKESARIRGLSNAQFLLADGRSIDSSIGAFSGAICLYDVVGTFPELRENERLLQAVARHLERGGRALFSVLNMELTQHIARRVHSIDTDPLALQTLPPSDLMQTSGNIFDPNFFLLDPKTGIVYRKEQFDGDGKPPGEFIVRDRRFTREGIEDLCSKAGLALLWARPFALGRWGVELEATDPRAKEIVFLVERR